MVHNTGEWERVSPAALHHYKQSAGTLRSAGDGGPPGVVHSELPARTSAGRSGPVAARSGKHRRLGAAAGS